MNIGLINKKVLKHSVVCVLLLLNLSGSGQGRNSIFFMGYHDAPTSNEGRITYSDTSYSLTLEQRNIPFEDTQANISDESGNVLMSSNGIFIADATGDTMLNGGGLNPGQVANDNKTHGLPMPYANLFLPMPGDTNKFILFHQVANYAAPVGLDALEIYYSKIDISQNGGLGSVISKNNIALTGVFSWGFAACRHGNGRDWWIVAMSDVATGMHTFLLTPDTLQYMGLQTFPITSFSYGYAGQPVFSPNGEKFAFGGSYGISGMNYLSCISLFNFDRCSGLFTLDTVIDYSDNYISAASAFSANSKYLYFSSVERLYQFDTYSAVSLPYQTVAINDTFPSAPGFYTNFFMMYLGANGKIYLSSGSSVLDIHEMNYPDSLGIACDLQMHNVHTNCFFIGVPNHPNYYLGREIGSPCDTLTSINDLTEHNFKFSISPNPTNGNIKIVYLLPQNRSGVFEVFDVNGKRVFAYPLPPWSTLQNFYLPHLADGMYECIIKSGGFIASKKLVVAKE